MIEDAIVTAGFKFDPGMGQRRSELAEFLHWLNQYVDPLTRVLEIGAGRGGSTYVFSQLAQVVSVDLPSGEGGMDQAACEARNGLLHDAFPSFVGLLGSSHDNAIREQVATYGPFDLIFIDGDHTLDGVRSDYDAYRHLARSGGIVAFHDINSELAPGVMEFWKLLVGEKLEFSEHGDWGGIGAVEM